MSHLTYGEAGIVGLIQGVTELFPLSSLGHSVLIPAIVGGQWAKDLNVSAPNSPYLAFIVGLHVATAIAMIIYFWRDWVRIIVAFFASLGHFARPEPGTRRWEPQGTDQTLAWMLILATIPVGIAGALLQHLFTHVFSKPVLVAGFLFGNGLILLGGERLRRRGADTEAQQVAADAERAAERQRTAVVAGAPGLAGGGGRHSSGQRAAKQQQASVAVESDRRLVAVGFRGGIILGSMQIFALLPGISRDGIVMVSGMFRGLSRQDAARFSFLLSAPVIFAAGLFKLHDLTGPLGHGIREQVLFGSVLSGIGAYLALRFLVRYLSDASRTLTPFAIYCLAAGLGSAIYLTVK
ncbi:MAG: undecaprenyl-diphosphate phosphatase [Streptosporangiaceae bacterium]|jgi:undecaprenyl-diphosphatase